MDEVQTFNIDRIATTTLEERSRTRRKNEEKKHALYENIGAYEQEEVVQGKFRQKKNTPLDNQEIHVQIARLRRLTQRSKIFLATASTMIDDVKELNYLFPLILSETKGQEFQRLNLETPTFRCPQSEH